MDPSTLREPGAAGRQHLRWEGPEGGQAWRAESSEFSEQNSLRSSSRFPSFPVLCQQ